MDDRIIKARIEALGRRSTATARTVLEWESRTGVHRGPESYEDMTEWSPTSVPARWPALRTVFVRFRTSVPQAESGSTSWLVVDGENLEGLVSIDGKPYAGADSQHLRIPLNMTGPIEVDAEFISVPSAMWMPKQRELTSLLREIRIEQTDIEIAAAKYDFEFAWMAACAMPDGRRKLLVQKALDEALVAVDLTLPPDGFRREVIAAREVLRVRLADVQPDPQGLRVFLTGHSHIDTAWLWPLRETIRKCGRTFATMCRLLERHPEFKFSCSQPQLYAYTRRHFPTLYDEIKRWIERGRWEATSGMWVESDCNIPSGEALIRQFLHGLRLFRTEFNARPRTCWLPDVFGYPGNLPQIIAGCGLDAFYTNKLHWQARNRFPYSLFQWEGIDGTRVLASIPRLKRNYNGNPVPEELFYATEQFSQKGEYDEVLFPFGFGDGGGGPTDEMLEFARRAGSFPGVPESRQGIEEEYFDQVRKSNPKLPVWQGELYLETHRGTFTSQAAVKLRNRQSELALRDAEIAGTCSRWMGHPVDMTELDEAWERLLCLQFHDILPGSSIATVYREAEEEFRGILDRAHSITEQAMKGLSGGLPSSGLLVFNTLSWDRTDVVRVRLQSEGDAPEIVDSSGKSVPVQKGEDDEYLFIAPDVPAVGYSFFQVRRTASAPGGSASSNASSMSIAPDRMENRFFIIEIDRNGEITRLFDKFCGREVVPQGQPANRFHLFQDGPERESAWNLHSTFELRDYPFEGESSVIVSAPGPVMGSVRVTRKHRESMISQEIVIYDEIPRIDFVTDVEWQERQVILKVAFPVDVRSEYATFETQFGAVTRPTHRNTSWDQEKFEVPAQRWADLSEAGYGASLLNDCKYGYDVKGNVLRLSLLRGSEYPDPDADRGSHHFTYALYPHAGDWRTASTVQQAWELNVPLLCHTTGDSGAAKTQPYSFLSVQGPAVLEALKPADDGNGYIARFYEPRGGRGPVAVRLAQAMKSVVSCNLVEETDEARSVERPSESEFTFRILPYQIRSFRIMP